MNGSLFEYAAYFFRTPAAFRMELRGWGDHRLRDAETQLGVLPDAYRLAYREEVWHRQVSYSRGGRELWE